jgi:hypothetical protein
MIDIDPANACQTPDESNRTDPVLQAEPQSLQESRYFDTGATRDTDAGKLDFEGFLCPFALECYAEYMDENRVQSDGKLRDSDNWQKGIPKDQYMKSAWRHFHDWWKIHRGGKAYDIRGERTLKQSIGGLLFNTFGYLHETLKEEH